MEVQPVINDGVKDFCQTNGGVPPAVALRRMIFGHRVTRLLSTAVELNLADHLDCDEPRDATELSRIVDANPLALRRFLRALASIGVVGEEADGRFVLTPVGVCLRSGVQGSMRSWILCEGSEYFQKAWASLTYAVKSGGVAFEHAHGMTFYEYMSAYADVGENFSSTMTDATAMIADAVVAAYEFEGVRRVVDVGGGYGMLLLRILDAVPNLEGVLFDVPSVVAAARPRIEKADAGNRCELVEGDIFTALPAQGDVYLLSRIIMDYDDDGAERVLRGCREVMAPNGRILVLQQLLPPPGREVEQGVLFDSLMSDVCMLVLQKGWERTEEQYRELFEKAGLSVSRVIPTTTAVSIIEGRRRHEAH